MATPTESRRGKKMPKRDEMTSKVKMRSIVQMFIITAALADTSMFMCVLNQYELGFILKHETNEKTSGDWDATKANISFSLCMRDCILQFKVFHSSLKIEKQQSPPNFSALRGDLGSIWSEFGMTLGDI